MNNSNEKEQDFLLLLNKLVKEIKAKHLKLCKKNLPKDLVQFVIDKTPLLNDKKYSFAQRIHWVIYKLSDFPYCGNPKCDHQLVDPKNFDNAIFGYRPGCCASCSQKSTSTKIKLLNSVAKIDDVLDSSITNIFQLNSVKKSIQATFSKNYGEGIINPGQVFNRKKGYDSYLNNFYVIPKFSYEEYNEMCKKIDRYHNKDLLWECRFCHHIFQTNVKTKVIKPDGIHATSITCPKCFHYKGSSLEELQIIDYIQSFYKGQIQHCNRTVLKSKYELSWSNNHEIDIWLPDINLAIEFNGTFYHADPRFYNAKSIIIESEAKDIWIRDQIKIDVFKRLKINYLIIWQYEWEQNQEEVKQIIKNTINDII